MSWGRPSRLGEDEVGLVGAAAEEGHAGGQGHELQGEDPQVARRTSRRRRRRSRRDRWGRRGVRASSAVGGPRPRGPARGGLGPVARSRRGRPSPSGRVSTSSSSGAERMDDELVQDPAPRGEGLERPVAADERDPGAALVALGPVTTMTPTSAVERGWVPPQGWRSKPSASTRRTSSSTPSGGRAPRARASSARDRADGHRPRLPDDLVGAGLGRARPGPRSTGRARSMVVTSAPEVEADRSGARRSRRRPATAGAGRGAAGGGRGGARRRRGPGPVPRAAGGRGRGGRRRPSSITATHRGVAQGPGVPGLAAALGVEGGPVEDHRGAAVVLAGLQRPGPRTRGGRSRRGAGARSWPPGHCGAGRRRLRRRGTPSRRAIMFSTYL